MKPSCGATRPNGYACINPAQDGKRVCAAHDPAHWCGASTAKGSKCRRMRMQGHRFCSKHVQP